jgi:hypothetical protein
MDHRAGGVQRGSDGFDYGRGNGDRGLKYFRKLI